MAVFYNPQWRELYIFEVKLNDELMKHICLFVGILLTAGQIEASLPDNPEDYYNFWIGTWEVSWDEGDGKIGKGINEINRTLNGKVIRENFRILEGQAAGFKGTSMSVYQPNLKRWKQAWSDSGGGYFDFVGDLDGDKRIFKTDVIKRGDKELILRMVFRDIKTDSFTWDWEASADGGKTWKLNWQINYVRKEKTGNAAFGRLNPDAPSQTVEFGQFVGKWDCKIWNRQADDSWVENNAVWVWNYVLNGMAVQDYWYGATGLGTNVRIFDPALDKWQNVWIENVQKTMGGLWDAKMNEDGAIEMYDDTGTWKITFFNILDRSFDWKWDFKQEDGSMKTMVKIRGEREVQCTE